VGGGNGKKKKVKTIWGRTLPEDKERSEPPRTDQATNGEGEKFKAFGEKEKRTQ